MMCSRLKSAQPHPQMHSVDGPSKALPSAWMAYENHEPKPTQKTQPKKGEPIEIPVPKVSTIRAAIRKVAKPDDKRT